jgi:hypothetical protein
VFNWQIEQDSKKRRQTASSNLRVALQKGEAEPERRIYVDFPSLSEHANHITGEVQLHVKITY